MTGMNIMLMHCLCMTKGGLAEKKESFSFSIC